MQNYGFDESEAGTILFSTRAVLRESGYSGPVVIDAADSDAYVAAAFVSQQLPRGFIRQNALIWTNRIDLTFYYHCCFPSSHIVNKSNPNFTIQRLHFCST